MADFKRRTLYLSTGKQIKLFGTGIAIGKSLELAEGYTPNVFSLSGSGFEESVSSNPETESAGAIPARTKRVSKTSAGISNPYRLRSDEILEIADYNIRLWMDLKD